MRLINFMNGYGLMSTVQESVNCECRNIISTFNDMAWTLNIKIKINELCNN